MGLFPKMVVYLPADSSILSNVVYSRSKQSILVQYSLSPGLKLSSHLKKAVTELVFLFSLFISFSIFLGNSYVVYASPEPFISIILSPDSISFHADTSPGTFASKQTVDVTVRSDNKNWSIHCEVISPLRLSGKTNKIPFERLFINTPYTDPDVDNGAGPGYESMDQPRLVAKSSLPGAAAIVNNLKFRLLTKWEDKPGTYVGQIRFTYLTNP